MKDRNGVIGRVIKFFSEFEIGGKKFSEFDLAVLKTMMRLAAVDGEVSKDELDRFRELAEKCRGCNDESFAKLWKDALRSAGYMALQTKLLSHDELVDEFVRESESDFVETTVFETKRDRDHAIAQLESMASADGEYSGIERDCIEALANRVRNAWEHTVTARYSRAATIAR